MSANLMAAKVKKHPKYDYRVKQWDTNGCVITFYEIPYPGAPRDQWDELGDSSFNDDDAKAREEYDPVEVHGLPISLQLTGRRLEEEKILAIVERVLADLA